MHNDYGDNAEALERQNMPEAVRVAWERSIDVDELTRNTVAADARHYPEAPQLIDNQQNAKIIPFPSRIIESATIDEKIIPTTLDRRTAEAITQGQMADDARQDIWRLTG